MFHLGKTCTNAIFWAFVALSVLLLVIVLAVKYAVMPNVQRYQGDIVSRVAAITGMDVSATAIRGGWSGFRPYIELENVVFREPADAQKRTAGAEALRLPQLQASLSWWSLLLGQLRFADVSLISPELALSRGPDGLIYFAGRALNQTREVEDDGRFLQALLEQPGISIRHATLTWTDELAPSPSLKFTDVGLILERRIGGHAIGVVATPPSTLARNVSFSAMLAINNENGRWRVAGAAYTQLQDANLAEIRRHVSVPDALQSGSGNVRAWIDIDNSQTVPTPPGAAAIPATGTPENPAAMPNPLRAITADVNIVNARAQLGSDLSPLQVARLGGRLEYVAQENGFTLRSKALEFRTRDGVASPRADFSVTLKNQYEEAKASGEVTANGIDLNVLSGLLEYFPIGKDLRAVAARFGPRGLVEQSSFSWTGYLDKPSAYKLKGKLTDFGSNADEKIPGVAGFSGTVEGDEKGGKFLIASKNMQLDAPHTFRAPLQFVSLDSSGQWKVSADTIEIDLDNLQFANEDLSGQMSGRYWRYRAGGARAADEKGPGSLDLKGKFDRIKATRVPDYLPNGGSKSRDYIEWAIRDGDITAADFVLKGAVYDFPYHLGKGGEFRFHAKVKDIDYRYGEGWPNANDINGELLFENTHFVAKIDNAKILNAPVRQTTITIDDFAGTPPLLTIQGSADARAEDAVRYIKESPLLDSIGGFTRLMALDGPGKLELALKFPLGVKEQNKITGKYTMMRGHAKIAMGDKDKGIDIANLNGSVSFTEASVKSTPLTGVAYGNPMTASIAGAGEGGVAVDYSARADVAQLADVLPFRMPQQVTGIADFTGRVLSKGGATEVTIDSPMLGIVSTLPTPLAKRADEERKLRVAFSNTGLATEKIRVTLAGNANAATETRIDARFQRRFDARGSSQGLYGGIASVGESSGDAAVPEGVWLAGAMPRLDFDAWREAIDGFYPAVAPPATAPAADAANARDESPIAGFDFKLGSLLAYGRPFKAMSLKGRHSGRGWAMKVDSDEASGDFTWRPAAFNDRGLVRARLQRFALADEAPTAAPAAPVEPGKEPDFPAFDIVADKFTFKDRELGKLELRATPQAANWKIDMLNISNAHSTLEMQGLWLRLGDPQNPAGGKSRTTMSMKMQTSNLNALFDQFGFGDYVKGGRASLDGQLSWPGHASQFQASLLSGNFSIEASDGRFAKIKPGAGKLLGLISLQSIPRRITLDFRDVFSEGFAFDKIAGDMKINNGVIFTDNFEIKGPAADIKMVGDVSLPNENQNLVMTVKPSLGEGVAIGAGVVLGPAVGAGVLLAQKLMQGAATYEYAVTGSWDNPQVDKLKQVSRADPPAGEKTGTSPATATSNTGGSTGTTPANSSIASPVPPPKKTP